MTNDQLKNLYSSFFRDQKLDPEMATRCSPPLLLHVEQSWGRASERILVIGQETQGWAFQRGHYYDWPYQPIISFSDFMKSSDRIDALMSGYKAFAFAKHQPENYRSPFWRAFRHLSSSVDVSILWTNLFRFSVDSGSSVHNCSSAELENVIHAQTGLLQKEIELLRPTVAVFFTGPQYDRALLREFPDAVFRPVGDRAVREFARVVSEKIPSKAYRLYHPGYLARNSDRWRWLDDLFRLIRA